MIKFVVKCIIVLLVIQSAMKYLRKEEIIEGSIKINYPNMQRKLLALIPTEKIANGIFEFTEDRIQGAIAGEKQTDKWAYQEAYNESIHSFKSYTMLSMMERHFIIYLRNKMSLGGWSKSWIGFQMSTICMLGRCWESLPEKQSWIIILFRIEIILDAFCPLHNFDKYFA